MHAAIRTGIEMDLFEKMAEDGGGAKSAEKLAEMTGSDAVLLGT